MNISGLTSIVTIACCLHATNHAWLCLRGNSVCRQDRHSCDTADKHVKHASTCLQAHIRQQSALLNTHLNAFPVRELHVVEHELSGCSMHSSGSHMTATLDRSPSSNISNAVRKLAASQKPIRSNNALKKHAFTRSAPFLTSSLSSEMFHVLSGACGSHSNLNSSAASQTDTHTAVLCNPSVDELSGISSLHRFTNGSLGCPLHQSSSRMAQIGMPSRGSSLRNLDNMHDPRIPLTCVPDHGTLCNDDAQQKQSWHMDLHDLLCDDGTFEPNSNYFAPLHTAVPEHLLASATAFSRSNSAFSRSNSIPQHPRSFPADVPLSVASSNLQQGHGVAFCDGLEPPSASIRSNICMPGRGAQHVKQPLLRNDLCLGTIPDSQIDIELFSSCDDSQPRRTRCPEPRDHSHMSMMQTCPDISSMFLPAHSSSKHLMIPEQVCLH